MITQESIIDNKTWRYGLLFVLLGLLFVNLNTPLWGNMLLAYGSFFHAGSYVEFPEVVWQADYIRGPIYKLLMYGMMKWSLLYTDMSNYGLFQFITKISYYVLMLSATWIFSYKALHFNKNQLTVLWALTWIIIQLTGYRTFMESEELAAIFALLHLVCLISEKPFFNYLSGLFLLLLIGCKAITISYAGFGFLFWLLMINDSAKTKRIIISHLSGILLIALLYTTVLSQEIDNLKEAMELQGSAKISGLTSLKKFSIAYLKTIPYNPTQLFILLSLPLLVLHFNIKNMVLILGSFVIAAMAVILQNRFSSPYHFLSFIPVAILIYWLFFTTYKNWLNLLLIGCLGWIVYINFSSSPKPNKLVSNRLYKSYFTSQCENYSELNRIMETVEPIQNPILFLTGDCPPFFINKPTCGKRLSAIILNRSAMRPHIKETQPYLELLTQIKEYQGQFILYDEKYLPLEQFEIVKQKLSGYTPIKKVMASVPELGEAELTLYQKRN